MTTTDTLCPPPPPYAMRRCLNPDCRLAFFIGETERDGRYYLCRSCRESDKKLLDAMLAPVGDDKMAKIASDNSPTYYHDSAFEGTDKNADAEGWYGPFPTVSASGQRWLKGLFAALLLAVTALALFAGAIKADSQEAAIVAETERKRQAGLLPAEPIRFVERQDQPPTDFGRNFGAVDVADVAQEGAGR